MKLTNLRKILQDNVLLCVAGLMALLTTVGYYAEEYSQPWRAIQNKFAEIIRVKFGKERTNYVETGVRQIYIKDLGVVDRCVTCHLGMEWKGLEYTENPYRTHPAEILKNHPIQKFGCTICHGGQGYSTDFRTAYAHTANWQYPVLGTDLEKSYLFRDRGVMIQINCNRCHRYERETEGLSYINYAKQLVKKIGCNACHKINGRGGVVGPDLTYEGDKGPEMFDFRYYSGENKTVFNWHLAHLRMPTELVPTSIMPNFHLSSRDILSLTMLIMSWRSDRFPVQYLPGVKMEEERTPEEVEKEKIMLAGPGRFFVEKTCFVCHSVKALDVISPTNIGPDLTLAPDDVVKRFGVPLEQFLTHPKSTMQIVLSTQIKLSPEEVQQAITLIKQAYEIGKKRQEQENKAKGVAIKSGQ